MPSLPRRELTLAALRPDQSLLLDPKSQQLRSVYFFLQASWVREKSILNWKPIDRCDWALASQDHRRYNAGTYHPRRWQKEVS